MTNDEFDKRHRQEVWCSKGVKGRGDNVIAADVHSAWARAVMGAPK